MLDLNFLKSSKYFEEISLKKWEILFDEWEHDIYLYIIYNGELAVERSINRKQWEYKLLSLITLWNILWESSLSRQEPKQVRIKAHRESILLRIDGQKDLPKFIEDHPKEWYKLLLTIVDIANMRLLRANRELTANYELSRAISQISQIDMKSIIELLSKCQEILEVDQILYFEKNMVMDEYYKLKYNSLDSGNFQNAVFKISRNSLDLNVLKETWVILLDYLRWAPLLLENKNHGFLIIGKKWKDFHESEEKLLWNTATSLVWIIRQKEFLDNERNKLYMKNI